MKFKICAISIPFTIFLAICATRPEIIGPAAANITADDLRQIKQVASNEPNLEHKVVQVEAIHADKVRVKVGGPDATGSHYNKYVVIKRAGRWIRDPFSELEDDRTFSGR